MQKSARKFLVSIFWDQDDIPLIDYLPQGQTINAEYNASLLAQLKSIWKEKRRSREVHQGGLVLAQCPGSLGTCNTEQTGLPSTVLITHPTLRIWPRHTATCTLHNAPAHRPLATQNKLAYLPLS